MELVQVLELLWVGVCAAINTNPKQVEHLNWYEACSQTVIERE